MDKIFVKLSDNSYIILKAQLKEIGNITPIIDINDRFIDITDIKDIEDDSQHENNVEIFIGKFKNNKKLNNQKNYYKYLVYAPLGKEILFFRGNKNTPKNVLNSSYEKPLVYGNFLYFKTISKIYKNGSILENGEDAYMQMVGLPVLKTDRWPGTSSGASSKNFYKKTHGFVFPMAVAENIKRNVNYFILVCLYSYLFVCNLIYLFSKFICYIYIFIYTYIFILKYYYIIIFS